jgi:hypothetical protein
MDNQGRHAGWPINEAEQATSLPTLSPAPDIKPSRAGANLSALFLHWICTSGHCQSTFCELAVAFSLP